MVGETLVEITLVSPIVRPLYLFKQRQTIASHVMTTRATGITTPRTSASWLSLPHRMVRLSRTRTGKKKRTQRLLYHL